MDYRLPIRRPVVVAKKTENPKEIIEKNEEITKISPENIIYLSITDSVNTEESFGGWDKLNYDFYW